MKIGVRTAIPFAGLLALLFASFAWTAPDEDLLGKRDGYPVCRQLILGSQDQRCYVGNLSHSDEVAPFRVVKAGTPRQFRHVLPALQAIVTLQPIPDRRLETGLRTVDDLARQRLARARGEQALSCAGR